MTHSMNKSVRGEEGFTLVELAVVMIIIGLLVGGILKGQEMIANAQITSTVAQVKSIDAATSTFKDMFDAVPGDMLTPATRLPNCLAAPCNAAGNGDNRLANAPFAAVGGEAPQFFVHLSAADLLGGVSTSLPAGQWGGIYPEANIEGGFIPGYWNGGLLGSNANAKRGHYLSMVFAVAVPAGASNTLTPAQAFRLDNKIDDGAGNSGSVFDNGNACSAVGIYDEDNEAAICDLAIRFQS